jgi:hypothetical protein
MTTTSAGPEQGAPAEPTQTTCEELSENNTTARQAIIEQTKDAETQKEQRAHTKASGKGMTVGSVKSTIPGNSGTMTTSSDGTANALIPNSQCPGGTSEQKMGLNKDTRASNDPKHDPAKKKAGVLCESRHVHPGGGKGAHSECKSVNCLSNLGGPMRGGSMTFNVDWRSSTFDQGETSGMPCRDCHTMMCNAAAPGPIGCAIKIYLCNNKNEPEELTEDDCDPDTGYTNLCQKVDGNPTPGRTP